jgi:hypothetical protein
MIKFFFIFFSLSRDENDQEFVALVAMLLCGELEIRQDTFQAITTKSGVSGWSSLSNKGYVASHHYQTRGMWQVITIKQRVNGWSSLSNKG